MYNDSVCKRLCVPPSSHPGPTTPPTDPVNGTDTEPQYDSAPLPYIAIPVGVTIAVLGGIIVVTVCILIKVKRTATKAAHSCKLNCVAVTAQCMGWTSVHMCAECSASMVHIVQEYSIDL